MENNIRLKSLLSIIMICGVSVGEGAYSEEVSYLDRWETARSQLVSMNTKYRLYYFSPMTIEEEPTEIQEWASGLCASVDTRRSELQQWFDTSPSQSGLSRAFAKDVCFSYSPPCFREVSTLRYGTRPNYRNVIRWSNGTVRYEGTSSPVDPHWVNQISLFGHQMGEHNLSPDLNELSDSRLHILQAAFVDETLTSKADYVQESAVTVGEEVEISLIPTEVRSSDTPTRIVVSIRPDLDYTRTKCLVYEQGTLKEMWIASDFQTVDGNLPPFPFELIKVHYESDPNTVALTVLQFDFVQLNAHLSPDTFELGEVDGFSLRDATVHDTILGTFYKWSATVQ